MNVSTLDTQSEFLTILDKELTHLNNTEEFFKYLYDTQNSVEQLLGSKRKLTGVYFTGQLIAKQMIEEIVGELSKIKILNYDFFEPCHGCGVFIFEYLEQLKKFKFTKNEYKKILQNIYGAESSDFISAIFIRLYKKYCDLSFEINIDELNIIKNFKGPLLFDLSQDEMIYHTIDSVFDRKFDIIVTNPPYKNLKAEIAHFETEHLKEIEKRKYEYIKKYVKKNLVLSSVGQINLYKLFFEELVFNSLKSNGLVSLLIPSSFLSELSSTTLRKEIITEFNTLKINFVPENSKEVSANQAMISILINKCSSKNALRISDFQQKNTYTLDALHINEMNNYSIYLLTEAEYEILIKLESFPKVKDSDFIKNHRGEFDLTLNKRFISNSSELKLIKGKNISEFELLPNVEQYVHKEFLINTQKLDDINSERIVGQQISNMKTNKRLKFAIVSKGHILGNSCNYLIVKQNQYGLTNKALLAQLTSDIINWYFKSKSSNNHISNFEIGNFPLILDKSINSKLEILVNRLDSTGNNHSEIQKEINYVVNNFYNVRTKDKRTHKNKDFKKLLALANLEVAHNYIDNLLANKIDLKSIEDLYEKPKKNFEYLLFKSIYEKYVNLKGGYLTKHNLFQLSELDMEMVKSIKPGGNWRDIPQKTVDKSKRLQQIKRTGGRTTLYGRLSLEKPSYTITTYFNRPGNGTYIHPFHNRVISIREAARLQSFPDSYYFSGSNASILKQIGNAIPPLLAKEFGKKFKSKGIHTSIDLFAGTGGLTYGLEQGGVKTVLASDNMLDGLVTLKTNNLSVKTILGDITEDETKQQIYKEIKKYSIDLIAGGPPCQGFSYAGKRFVDDPRNQLFKEFYEIVKYISPKSILIENVPGMLTLDKGRIYREIFDLFNNIGYTLEGRLLMANDYGVPQKRKRLFIIGVKKEENFLPNEIFPKKLNSEKSVNVNDALQDILNLQCGENVKVVEKISNNDYLNYLKTN